MNGPCGMRSVLPKLAALALAMRLVTPFGFACQLNDRPGDGDAAETAHCHSDADHDAPLAAHGHQHDGSAASGHACHDRDDNCTCSLTFIPEFQPSRGPESADSRASSPLAVAMPVVPTVATVFVADYHRPEVFHPPPGVGVESVDSPRGPPRFV